MSALLIKLTNQEDFNKVMEFIHANKMEVKTDYAPSMFYEEEAAGYAGNAGGIIFQKSV